MAYFFRSTSLFPDAVLHWSSFFSLLTPLSSPHWQPRSPGSASPPTPRVGRGRHYLFWWPRCWPGHLGQGSVYHRPCRPAAVYPSPGGSSSPPTSRRVCHAICYAQGSPASTPQQPLMPPPPLPPLPGLPTLLPQAPALMRRTTP